MDCPLLVWMLSINRDVLTEVRPILLLDKTSASFSPQEYDKCFHLVQDCVPHARLSYQPTSIDSFREYPFITVALRSVAEALQGSSSATCYPSS